MRKLLYIIMIFPILVCSQSSDQNWVKSKKYKLPTTTPIPMPTVMEAVVDVDYYDGLGRSIQQVAYAQSNSGKDIVTHVEYDIYGRIEKEFLPYVNQSSSLNFNASANNDVLNFYNTTNYENTLNPHSQILFDNSPLNRIMKQSFPGEIWKMNSGHEIKYEYELNKLNDSIFNLNVVRTYNETNKIFDYSLNCFGIFGNNKLTKTITKSENWVSGKNETVEEYKDALNKTILKRAFNNNKKHDTYYVYDDIGNLIYVIPPLVSENFLSINSINSPFSYNRTFDYSEFLISCSDGQLSSGGGGINVKILNGYFQTTIEVGCTLSKIDINKTFELDLPSSLPNVDLINFQNYTLYVENNVLKFKTNSTTLNCFTTIPPTYSYPYNLTAQFSTAPVYTATINMQILEQNAYHYKYDAFNRLIEKKIPGKQWEFIVYDKLDRVVATGPAYNPYGGGDISKGWMLTKYDVFNRPVYTAWYNAAVASSVDRKTLQTTYNSATTYSENKTTSLSTINGIATKYTNSVSPSTFILLTINYYDTYDYPNAPVVPTTLPDSTFPIATNVKGMLTGSWVRVLDVPGSTTNELSYTIYDNKFRPVRLYTKNYLGGFTQVDSKIDWFGKTEYTITTHKRTTSEQLFNIKERYTYSDQDRLVKHTHEIIGFLPEELLTLNTYDELGQLISKKVGGKISGSTALQNINYSYNIRGWLKGINNIENLTPTVTENDLFAYKINYDNPETATPLFNGNISETFWRTDADNKKRKYAYKYDNLNRLLEANYDKPDESGTLDNYLEKLSYDKAGNILTLERNGNIDPSGGGAPVNQIDNLVYTYDTNKKNELRKVNDLSNSPQGFNQSNDIANGDVDGNTVDHTDDYTYDFNGNMVTDSNKGIDEIKYNHLNLPTYLRFQGTTNGAISYIYNAVGQKVKKVVIDEAARTTTNTDYLSGFQYKDAVLQFFPHAEGYVHYTKPLAAQGGQNSALGNFNYVFNYTDHLGNVRVSFAKDPVDHNVVKILEENHYYAFGLKHQNYNVDKLNFEEYPETGVKIVPAPAVANATYNYKYNGKELQEELGLNVYDLGFRNYMPDIGRFAVIDPMADFINYQSPYVFSDNSPIMNVDEDGLGILNVIGNLFRRLRNGIVDIACSSCNPRREDSLSKSWNDPDFGWYKKTVGSKQRYSHFRPFSGKPVESIDIPGIEVDDNVKFDIPGLVIRQPEPVIVKRKLTKPIPIIGDRPSITFNSKVAFTISTTRLAKMSDETLVKIAKTLVDYPQLQVSISVNVTSMFSKWDDKVTIENEKMTYNILQSRRANAIRKFFIQRGVKPSQISTRRGVFQESGNPTTSFTIINRSKR